MPADWLRCPRACTAAPAQPSAGAQAPAQLSRRGARRVQAARAAAPPPRRPPARQSVPSSAPGGSPGRHSAGQTQQRQRRRIRCREIPALRPGCVGGGRVRIGSEVRRGRVRRACLTRCQQRQNFTAGACWKQAERTGPGRAASCLGALGERQYNGNDQAKEWQQVAHHLALRACPAFRKTGQAARSSAAAGGTQQGQRASAQRASWHAPGRGSRSIRGRGCY